MQWTETILDFFKEGYIMIISTKFGQDQASSLEGDVL